MGEGIQYAVQCLLTASTTGLAHKHFLLIVKTIVCLSDFEVGRRRAVEIECIIV